MTVGDVSSITGGGTVVAGLVKSGEITVGDTVCLSSGEGPFSVDGIESFNKVVAKATTGDRIGLLLSGVGAKEVKAGVDLIHCGAGPN
jgi:selenocysteine-specific translation elongation factor